MSVDLLSFSAPATGDLGELTAAHPSLRFEGTPMRDLLLLRCSGGPEAVSAVMDALPHRFLAGGGEGGPLTLIAEMPAPVAELLAQVDRQDAHVLPPLVWQGGRMHLRLLRFSPPGGAPPMRLPGAALESRVALRAGEVEKELLASGLLLPALTRRQGEAVLAALEAGYYDTPRKATAAEVAERMGIARSTFEEHLRAAESQLVRALSPVVRMRLLEKEHGIDAAGADALHLYARFSKDLGLYVSMTVRGERVTSVGLSETPPEEAGEDHPYLSRILEHISTGRGDLRDIPLELEVTPFEREVLEALRAIPPGEVVTYGELARRLRRPRASRAVGSACARNPALVVVPCHRVVPAAGGLGNYSAAGGPATKRRLLEREGALDKVKKGR